MASCTSPYEDWLSNKLLTVNEDIDAEVFVTYIIGILNTYTHLDEKRESLEELLGEVVEAGPQNLSEEILAEWEKTCSVKNIDSKEKDVTDIGNKLSHILGTQQLATIKERQVTDEERARKAAIVAQYGEVSEEDSDEEEPDTTTTIVIAPAGAKPPGPENDLLMFRNTNAAEVLKKEKEQRDKSKADSEKKKEKDKADREAQRQKQNERKDAEKKRTQKGERRR